MALARFSIQDSRKKIHFFEETFLLANTSIKVVLKMPVLALSHTNFHFGTKKLI